MHLLLPILSMGGWFSASAQGGVITRSENHLTPADGSLRFGIPAFFPIIAFD